MQREMHPVMQVDRSIVDGKPEYTLNLSRANFNHLSAGCPDFDRLVGTSPGGFYFCLFPGAEHISDSFRPMPDREGYYAYVGVPSPVPPPEVTSEEFDRLTEEYCNNLERAINESARIPIKESLFGVEGIFGHATMKVKSKSNNL
ncbi:MAG: hypothetical protein HY366_00735 [Candidatus Aenigmarchaeota archaeon]|nr:hypothetical protein [Candidatus Aenigmarchaeota archaeon]